MKTTPAAPAASEQAEELDVLKTIKSIREGEFVDELNDAMQEAIDTATELGKAASLTITLKIAPAGRTVVIDDDINPKLPKKRRDSTIFFLDTGNKLTTKDPKQTQFPAEAGFKGAAAAVNA